MSITRKEVEHVAELARLALDESEKEQLTAQLAGILDYVKQLEEVDTVSVEPMAQPLPLKNVFREDKVQPDTHTAAILKNAPETEDRFFKVPKVIE